MFERWERALFRAKGLRVNAGPGPVNLNFLVGLQGPEELEDYWHAFADLTNK